MTNHVRRNRQLAEFRVCGCGRHDSKLEPLRDVGPRHRFAVTPR